MSQLSNEDAIIFESLSAREKKEYFFHKEKLDSVVSYFYDNPRVVDVMHIISDVLNTSKDMNGKDLSFKVDCQFSLKEFSIGIVEKKNNEFISNRFCAVFSDYDKDKNIFCKFTFDRWDKNHWVAVNCVSINDLILKILDHVKSDYGDDVFYHICLNSNKPPREFVSIEVDDPVLKFNKDEYTLGTSSERRMHSQKI